MDDTIRKNGSAQPSQVRGPAGACADQAKFAATVLPDAATAYPSGRAEGPVGREAIGDTSPAGGVPTGIGSGRPAQDSSPRHFGKYELVQELGRGGMGVVYKAYHPGLKQHFAIKVLLAGADASAQDIQRFHREAEASARLKHPGIVSVHDVGEEEGKTYFAMEFVDGLALDKALADPLAAGLAPAPLRPGGHSPGRTRHWGLNASAAVQMTQEIAEAVQAAHDMGVIHRDLKPANVIRDRNGRLKVMDFGLAKLVDTGKTGVTRAGAVMGTPAYMSPEQADGRVCDVDARSDVYQLGAILYELLTGRPPYDGDTALDILLRVMQEDPTAPRRVNPRIPRDAETICLKAMMRERTARYASARALAEDCARFLAEEPIVARPVSTGERLWRKGVKYRRILVPFVTVLLVAGGLGVYGLYARAARRSAEGQAARAEQGETARAAEVAAERVLVRAEGLWHDAKLVLYRPEIPLALYHEQLDEAMKLYDEAIRTCPTYGWIYESRARVRIQTNDLHKAEEDLKEAIRLLGPESRKAARRSLGRVYLERSFDLLYAGTDDERRRNNLEANQWRARALEELQASTGPIEWRGGAAEERVARTLAEAWQASAGGDGQRARAALVKEIERHPDEELAWGLSSLLADAAERDRWREKALSLRPRYARALYDRGNARRDKGDLDGAIADTTRALEIDRRYALAYNTRGNARHDQGDLDGAIADYTHALEIDPKYAPAYNNRGIVRHDKGDLDGAIADTSRALEIDPQYAVAYNSRGTARRDQGDLDGAIADYTHALAIDPRCTAAYANRGTGRTVKGELDGAIADYTHALAIDPKCALAYAGRGDARGAKGDLDGAIADTTRALEIDPKCARAYTNRGLARQHQGDLDGAIADSTRALEIDSKCAAACVNRGLARQAKGDLEGAIADSTRALEIDPKGADALCNRGFARQVKGDLDGAIADATRALEIDPKLAHAYGTRGNARRDKGELDGAIADYTRALEINPKLANAYCDRGAVRQAKGDLDGAIADYDRALEIDPRFVVVYINRGLAIQTKGDRGAALADFRKALEVAPPGWPRRKALEDLIRSAGGK